MSSENLLTSGARAYVDGAYLRVNGPAKEAGHGLFSCFGLCPDQSLSTSHSIPLSNIIWCEKVSAVVEVTYVEEKGNSTKVRKEQIEMESYEEFDWAARIMGLAYPEDVTRWKVLVLVNNFGGQGNGRKLYESQIEPVLRAAHVDFDYLETDYAKHAIDIGRGLDLSKYTVVACCSGDGVPHEIINGMYERKDRADAFNKVAVTQLPCGSGNALALSTYGTNKPGLAALRMLKLARCKMDLMAVTQNQNTKLSFLSQAYGIIADADIGTDHLRWMGPVRFDLGVTHKVFTRARYPCDLQVRYAMKGTSAIRDFCGQRGESIEDLEVEVKEEDLVVHGFEEPLGTDWEEVSAEVTDNLNIFYVGNMPYMLNDAQFFPGALPNDGNMDMVITTTKIPVLEQTKLLLSVGQGGHVTSPLVHHSKITAYRLTPRVSPKGHYISVDGESFPVQPLHVELLKSAVTVLLPDKSFVRTCFRPASQ